MVQQVVLLRVGVDAGSGGIQGPLFEDGTFEFICIPDRHAVSVHTYGSMCDKHGVPVVRYFPRARRESLVNQHVHVDPEFSTFTYGDPSVLKRSLRYLRAGDLLVFYCGLQRWDAAGGWDINHRPALYLAGYFEVALAGMATEFDEEVLAKLFAQNFHVRYPAIFEKQRDDLVLVKGGPGNRLFGKAHQISAEGQDRAGKPLKVLSPEMQRIFGAFGGHIAIQRSPPRWVEAGFIRRAVRYVENLE